MFTVKTTERREEMSGETSLLWFISGQAWLSDGTEGDLLGVTSTGEPE